MLAATLSTVGTIPVTAIMLIFGFDEFMSECRALTNMIGNSVATLVVATWEGVFDQDRARCILDGKDPVDELDILDEEPRAAGRQPPGRPRGRSGAHQRGALTVPLRRGGT